MGGFEATREIMITAPTPILIVTANSRIEVSASLDALGGCVGVLLKPSMPGTPGFGELAERLIETVKSLCVRVTRLRLEAAGVVEGAVGSGARSNEIRRRRDPARSSGSPRPQARPPPWRGSCHRSRSTSPRRSLFSQRISRLD